MKPRFVTLAVAAIATLGACLIPLTDAAPASGSRVSPPIPQLNIGATGLLASSLNPAKNLNAYYAGTAMALETLFRFGPQGQLIPNLATSFTHHGSLVYIYHLRHNVKFWDGDSLTATDVAYSWNHDRVPGSEVAFAFDTVKSVVAAGRYSVVVTLTHPDASWQYTPAELNSEVFEAKFAEQHKGTFGDPGVLVMGTGPWEIDSYDPTTGAELSANPRWWGGKVPIARISIKSFANETSEGLAFRAGEIDVATLIADPHGFAATSGAKLLAVPSCNGAMFSMNTQQAPWSDVHVRRAVAYAIDRLDVITGAGGYASPNYTLITPGELRTLASPAQVAHLLKSLPLYQYNVAKAKAEMAESAYPKGFTTTLQEYSTSSGQATEVIAAELQKIGIHATVKVDAYPTWLELLTATPARTRPTSYFTNGCFNPDPSSYYDFLGSKNTQKGEYNTADWAPPGVDQLLSAGVATTDHAKRFAVYTKLLRLLAIDEPYVPLYVSDTTMALSRKFVDPSFNSWVTLGGDFPLGIRPAR